MRPPKNAEIRDRSRLRNQSGQGLQHWSRLVVAGSTPSAAATTRPITAFSHCAQPASWIAWALLDAVDAADHGFVGVDQLDLIDPGARSWVPGMVRLLAIRMLP
jgi:hypothetical protein